MRPTARTVVSFTFDDGDADQLAAAKVLQAHGMRATFYIITGAVGTPGYLTRADLGKLAAAGNEIAGHTVSHLDLSQVTRAEARRQICGGRDTLIRWGFHPTSFAYPGAVFNPAIEAMAAGCGFRSARIATGLDCPGCAAAESVPPANRYTIRTPGQVDGSWTLARLERTVLDAERSGGGWVPLVFHRICAGGNCGDLSIRASTLDAFAAWLARRATSGTVVRTVGQVVGGPVRPAVSARPAAPHGVVNASMESMGPSGAIDPSREEAGSPGSFLRCWTPGGYGRNTVRWERTRDAHSGRWAQRVVVSDHVSGDAKLLQQFDLGACSLPVSPGRSYQLSAWYQATVRTQFAVYYRDAAGRWVYWTSSPFFAPEQAWTRASWQTPPVPANATGVSYGLAIASDGSVTTDDYSFTLAPRSLTRQYFGWGLLGLASLAAAAGARGLVRRRRAARRGPAGAGPAQPARPPGGLPASSSRSR